MDEMQYLIGNKKITMSISEPPIIYSKSQWESAKILAICLLGAGLLLLLCGCRDPVWASEVNYSDEQIAQAIYYAEGGAKTRHPYGILTKYKTTTPRQACINTIRHALRDWKKAGNAGDFIAYLQKRYAPLGVANDPTGLNRNWASNVNYFLSKSK